MLEIGFLTFGEILIDKSSPAKDDKAVRIVLGARHPP